VEHLPKNIGFGMGLEFREAINLLKAGNERKVAAGMVFNVAVGVCASALDTSGHVEILFVFFSFLHDIVSCNKQDLPKQFQTLRSTLSLSSQQMLY